MQPLAEEKAGAEGKGKLKGKGKGKGTAVEEALEQAGGCGGFGKGNFSELFKSIEDYERTLEP